MNLEILNIINNTINKKISNKDVINMFYKIGMIIYKNNYSLKQIYILEEEIRYKYGFNVVFSKNNLINIKKFYIKFKNYNLYLLQNIDWNTYLILIKKNKYIIDYVLKNKINKMELEYFILNKEYKKIKKKYTNYALYELNKIKKNVI